MLLKDYFSDINTLTNSNIDRIKDASIIIYIEYVYEGECLNWWQLIKIIIIEKERILMGKNIRTNGLVY